MSQLRGTIIFRLIEPVEGIMTSIVSLQIVRLHEPDTGYYQTCKHEISCTLFVFTVMILKVKNRTLNHLKLAY